MKKNTNNEKVNVPCIGCLIYPMCRSQCQIVLGFYMDVIPKCETIRTYLKITSWDNVGFNFEEKGFNSRDRIKKVKQALEIPIIKVHT